MDEKTQPCRVLEEDPPLAEAVPASQRDNAIRECLARCLSLPAGRWLAGEPHDEIAGEAIGLLLLSGLMLRRAGVDDRFGAELLGAGDLLRPWQGEEDPPILTVTTGWRVIEPARVAILDEPFARRAARYPAGGQPAPGRRRSARRPCNAALKKPRREHGDSSPNTHRCTPANAAMALRAPLGTSPPRRDRATAPTHSHRASRSHGLATSNRHQRANRACSRRTHSSNQRWVASARPAPRRATGRRPAYRKPHALR